MSLSMVMASPYRNVLFVGPGYKNHRGGIGAVLDIYSRNIEPFNFISTLAYKNKFYEMIFFSGAVVKLFLTLLTNRDLRIVHIHGAKDGSIIRKFFIAFIAKKIFARKIIFHSHAGAFNEFYWKRGNLYRSVCRFIINNSEAVIVLSDVWNDFFQKNFRIKKLFVLKNPVEHRPPVTVKAINNPGITTLLFLGRIADHKGIFDLINLLVEDQKEFRGKVKLLIGGNHEVERLQNAIKDGGIKDIAEYIGWVQDADKDRFFSMCDYFILPTYHEGMPMTILESLSYGKPVMTTPVGSIPEIIEDGKNGFLFKPGDMKHLKEILLHTISNRTCYESLRTNALNTAIDFYPESIKSELEKLYSEII